MPIANNKAVDFEKVNHMKDHNSASKSRDDDSSLVFFGFGLLHIKYVRRLVPILFGEVVWPNSKTYAAITS